MWSRKVKFVEQSEHSECGITSITMILNYLGIPVSLNFLRDKYGVPKGGNTLFHLKSIFQDFGISTSGFKVNDLKFFKENNRPCILFWDNKHYVVFERIKFNKIIIVDPALGRKKYSYKDFWEHFSSVVLVPVGMDKDLHLDYKIEKKKNILVSILFKQKLKIVGLILFTLLIQFFALGIPVITQRAVDNYKILSQDLTVTEIMILIGMVFGVYYVLQIFRTILIANFQNYFEKNLMTEFMKKIMSLPLSFFVNRSTGDLIFRSNLTTYIQQLLSSQLITTIIDMVFVVAYLSLMISYSVQLTVVSMFGIAIIIVSSFCNTKRYQYLTDKELTLHSKIHRTLVELFEGMETVKSIGAEKQFYEDWEKNFIEQLKVQMSKNRASGFIGNIATATQFIMPLMIMGVGIYGISNGSLTVGELISFNAIATAFVTPIITIMGSYSSIMLLQSYFGKLSEILEQKVQNEDSKEVFDEDYESIELRNVSFQYSKFEDPILKNINISIGKHEKVAIVGPSGSGKSTLVKVLSGLYSPSEGEVLLNGKDIKGLTQESIRQKVSMVNQNPAIFNMSLKDNILMNKSEVDESLFMAAVKDARVNEIIDMLPMGYETQVSEGGMNLSGGQMQRIAIARAIVNTPELMLMDEPTSALDNISENYIMNRVKEYDFPCVVVSHRLNTIQHFDRVIVMYQGRIVEEGTHDELMKKRGLYSYIYSGNLEASELKGEQAIG
ncbi:peptidase domain-containing ABC transporter [Mediterraneibacter agrestimuris]|uniref:peptidase domain-containing ABC transporter n=1 Tax=Mediterraneibacter agrestimuris TaxID=2941333 RepID=UPI00203B39D1|nr:peptidase domain-containing ABC transporter [Mediterraneibacter agrestimuris]